MNEKEARKLIREDGKTTSISRSYEIAQASGYIEAIEKANYIIRLLSEWGPILGGEIEEDFKRIKEKWEKEK